MPAKKQIQPGEKLPLKLTAAERKLILDEFIVTAMEYEALLRDTPLTQPLMLTLDELEDFGGYIAAEANHCDDTKKQKKLDAIFEKIQFLQDRYTDEESPPIIKLNAASKLKPQSKLSKKTARPRATPATTLLYQFKITLLGSKPLIWRRIQVKDCTLDKLHEHIQTAMGWTNSHLHQFEIKGRLYGDPEFLDDGFGDFEFVDSTRTNLSQILPKIGKRFAFKYEYDFGDGWEHEVLFEGSPTIDAKAKYPHCLEGERACPPEDIGGIWGYAEYLEALADPKHERHAEFMEWSGKFDPETFDPKQATKEMRKGLPDWRICEG